MVNSNPSNPQAEESTEAIVLCPIPTGERPPKILSSEREGSTSEERWSFLSGDERDGDDGGGESDEAVAVEEKRRGVSAGEGVRS